MKVICEHAGTCDNQLCEHKEPHEPYFDCTREPCSRPLRGRCIPVAPEVSSTSMPVFDDEPDYKAMWLRLRREVSGLVAHKAHALDPLVLDRFMDYIEEAVK